MSQVPQIPNAVQVPQIPQVSPPRPDVDIEEDVAQLIRSYSPLKASHSYFKYQAHDGVVSLIGNVRSPQARRVLIDNVPNIAGVKQVDASALYDDETIRLAVGSLLPDGVMASVHFGAVALTGRLPAGASADEVTQKVGAIAGVKRVGAELGAPINSA